MDSHAKMNISASEKEQNAKLMAELAREEARNAEAIRMVKEKELQALAAKDRAADSQRRMQDMMVRYEEMKQKLEWTRLTLEHTASQINQNDIKRAQQIQATVSRLKEKAEHCSGILKRKRERDGANASSYIAENNEDAEQFGADTGNSLTEVEKKLLLLCQSQTSLSTNETEDDNQTSLSPNDVCTSGEPNLPSTHAVNDDTSLTDAERMLLVMCQKEKSENTMENENIVDNRATKIEETESSTASNSNETSEDTVVPKVEDCNVVTESKNLDHEHGNRNLSQDIKESETAVITVDALDTIEVVEPKDSINIKHEHNVDAEEFDLKEVTKDLKETVTNIEAKCAGVRDELGQMAMSEQYMRTKQAQLLAKRKEKEAEKALEAAAIKELEAQKMREKVANMMKLLEERKNKLKQTENVLDKRANVVDKVNKVLDSKLRKADFVQKQRDECLAFDISHKNLISTEKENSDKIEIEDEKKAEDQSITQDEDDQEPKKCADERSSNDTDSSLAKTNTQQENQTKSNTEEETIKDSMDSQL